MVEKKSYYDKKVHHISPSEVALLFRMLGTRGKILDVACGSGDIGAHAPDSCILYGFDHDDHARRVKSYKEVRVLDIETTKQLPYPKASFDGAILKDVLEHLDDPLAALQKAVQVTRTGGRVLITVPNARPKNVWNDYTHRRGFTKNSVRMLCEDAGLRVLAVKHTGGIPGFGLLGLHRLGQLIVNTPLLGVPFRTGWMVLCEK